MSRKRRVFDIEMPSTLSVTEGKVPDHALQKRRGPMAAAISENADALRDRQTTEEAIREENDKLAHELVRLRAEGLITERIALDDVATQKLTRDRKPGPDPDLQELKESIRDIGLSNPIRVERRADGSYELIQGMRRLLSYKALLQETGEDRFRHIPAAISESAGLEDSYRQMVDENLVRKNISFAEMGLLARAYSQDPANDCPDVDKAVAQLFKSASYTKRSYIRAFASLTGMLEKVLAHPTAIPRNVGVELKRRIDAEPALVGRVSAALQAEPDRDATREVKILRGFASNGAGEPPAPAARPASAAKARQPKTTFQVPGRKGVAKCAASNGRIELRYDLDFTRVDRARLERAMARLIEALQDE